MEGLSNQLERVKFKSLVIRGWNIAATVAFCLSLLMLVIAWAIAITYDDGQLRRRHIDSIIAFIFAAITILFNVIVIYVEPRLRILYTLQLMAVPSIALNAVSAGMAVIVIDVCASGGVNESTARLHCPAHVLEYSTGLFLCVCMASVFVTTQQKAVAL